MRELSFQHATSTRSLLKLSFQLPQRVCPLSSLTFGLLDNARASPSERPVHIAEGIGIGNGVPGGVTRLYSG